MHSVRQALTQLPPPRFDPKLETRRSQVLDWLRFVRDFGQIDTTPLLERAVTDDEFIDAVEAVTAIGVDAATAYDALRGLVVQLLFREGQPAEQPMNTRRTRPSPYSVPIEMLRAVFTYDTNFPGIFTPNRLSIGSWQEVISPTQAGPTRFTIGTPQYMSSSYDGLLTNLWCHIVPPDLNHTLGPIDDLELTELAANRIHTIPLLAAAHGYVPLFVKVPPNGGFRVSLREHSMRPPVSICVFIEGWTYALY